MSFIYYNIYENFLILDATGLKILHSFSKCFRILQNRTKSCLEMIKCSTETNEWIVIRLTQRLFRRRPMPPPPPLLSSRLLLELACLLALAFSINFTLISHLLLLLTSYSLDTGIYELANQIHGFGCQFHAPPRHGNNLRTYICRLYYPCDGIYTYFFHKNHGKIDTTWH